MLPKNNRLFIIVVGIIVVIGLLSGVLTFAEIDIGQIIDAWAE